MADEQVALALLRRLHHQARGIAVQKIIRIDELQVFALRKLNGDVARSGYAGVFLVDDDHAGIQPRIHPADFKA